MTSPSQLARVAIVRAGLEIALVAAGNEPELVPSAQLVADAAHVIGRALRIYGRTSAAPLHAGAEHGVDHVSEEHRSGAVRHGAQPGSGLEGEKRE